MCNDRSLIRRYGDPEFTELLARIAEIDEGIGVAGAERHSGAVLRGRLLQSSQTVKGIAEIEGCIGTAGVLLACAPQHLLRSVEFALLAQNEAQID